MQKQSLVKRSRPLILAEAAADIYCAPSISSTDSHHGISVKTSVEG
jgi:hypothetical protein